MGDRSKRRRETIDEVFGEDVPRISDDERDFSTPEDEADRDRWLRENRPPHHL